MSRTKLHKDKGKWNNGYQENVSTKLLNFFTRYNNDWGEFRKAKKDLVDKIAEKELKQQIETDEYNFKQNGEFIEDIDDPYCTSQK